MADRYINVGGHKLTVPNEDNAQLLVDTDLTTEATTGTPSSFTLDVSALGDWKMIRIIITNSGNAMFANQTIPKYILPANDFLAVGGWEAYPNDVATYHSQAYLRVYKNTLSWSYMSTSNNRAGNNHVYIYKIA